ncbi:MAG TPA: VOC family protein [Polyangia bacterium]|jgi:catechol 2,3-dioxygenase-like lactoylglutathione lyase family enzyme|nr:VOC family protein [Polyangia bacterium]
MDWCKGTNPSLPVPVISDLGEFDHYTVIVENAQRACDFHVQVLGFEFLRTQNLNTGTVPEGEVDMINHVLAVPGLRGKVCVLTEGLTEETVFRRYMKKYGPGIHHVAFCVSDLPEKFSRLKEEGIKFTSDEVMRDPLTGLHQIFIAAEQGGYFIELIERTEEAANGYFDNDNMRNLALTMENYLCPTSGHNGSRMASARRECDITIDRPLQDVQAFLADPAHLAQWTCHRTIRKVDQTWKEVRFAGDVAFDLLADGGHVVFRWTQGDQTLRVVFELTQIAPTQCHVRVSLPALDPQRLARTQALLSAELRILRCLLEDRPQAVDPRDTKMVQEAHFDVYRRVGL